MKRSTSLDPDIVTETLLRRLDVILALRSGAATKRDLQSHEHLDVSRRTIDRAIDALCDVYAIDAVGTGYEVTLFGHLLTDLYTGYRTHTQSLIETADLLAYLPNDTPLDLRFMAGVETAAGPSAAPQAPFIPVAESLYESSRVRGMAPVVLPLYVDVFHDVIVEHGIEVELILPEAVVEAVGEHYTAEWQDAILAENSTFWAAESVPAFGLLIIDDEVWVGPYQDSGGGLAGTFKNESRAARSWAREVLDYHQADATTAIDEFLS